MNNELQREEALQRYLDGSCSDIESNEIAKKIETIPAWKQSFESLSEIHGLLQNNWDTQQPSMRFTKNIMEAIEAIPIAKPTREYINPMIAWLLGGLLGSLLVGVTVYAFSLADWSSSNSTDGMFSLKKVSLPELPWQKLFNSNTTMLLMVITLFLGLILMDQFLRSKKTTHL